MLNTILKKPTFNDTLEGIGYNSMQSVAALKSMSENLTTILIDIFNKTAVLSDIKIEYSSSDELKYKDTSHRELSQTLKCVGLASDYRHDSVRQIQEWFITILRTLLEIQRHLTIGSYVKTYSVYQSELSEDCAAISSIMLENRTNDPTSAHNPHTGKDGNTYFDVYTTINETSSIPSNIVSASDVCNTLLPAVYNIDQLLRWLVAHTDIIKIKNSRQYSEVDRSALVAANISNNQYNLLSYNYSYNNMGNLVIDLWGRKKNDSYPNNFDTYKAVNAVMRGYTVTGDIEPQNETDYFILDDDEYVSASTKTDWLKNDKLNWSKYDFYVRFSTYSPIDACTIPSECVSTISSVLNASNLGIDYNGLGIDCVRMLSVLFANLLQVKIKICDEFKAAYETINTDCRNVTSKKFE